MEEEEEEEEEEEDHPQAPPRAESPDQVDSPHDAREAPYAPLAIFQPGTSLFERASQAADRAVQSSCRITFDDVMRHSPAALCALVSLNDGCRRSWARPSSLTRSES
jgi:hypothetical protein